MQKLAGVFAEDSPRGQPIRVRFVWTRLGPDRARWEQHFSPLETEAFELNGVMEMFRT